MSGRAPASTDAIYLDMLLNHSTRCSEMRGAVVTGTKKAGKKAKDKAEDLGDKLKHLGGK